MMNTPDATMTSRIKLDADHAGLSELLRLLKIDSARQECLKKSNSLHKTSSHVTLLLTWLAMEDTYLQHGTILSTKEQLLRNVFHTPLRLEEKLKHALEANALLLEKNYSLRSHSKSINAKDHMFIQQLLMQSNRKSQQTDQLKLLSLFTRIS